MTKRKKLPKNRTKSKKKDEKTVIPEKTPTKKEIAKQDTSKKDGNGKDNWVDEQSCKSWDEAEDAISNQLYEHCVALLHEGIPAWRILKVYQQVFKEIHAEFLELAKNEKVKDA